MAKFFRLPFANNGERTALPDGAQANGSVSYTQGFGPDYEKILTQDPNAKDIDRKMFNSLMYEMHLAIYDIQSQGNPQWFSSFNYPKGATVWYGGEAWLSRVANNTSTPGADENWMKLVEVIESAGAGSIVRVPINGLGSGNVQAPKKCKQVFVRGWILTTRDFIKETKNWTFTVNGRSYGRTRQGSRGGSKGHSYYSTYYIPFDELIDMPLNKGDTFGCSVTGNSVLGIQMYIEFL